MEHHFLDSTGLSHLWQRIREHFAPINHEHANKMNLMQSPTVGRITVATSDGGVECSNISVSDVVKNDGGSYGVSITGNAASADTVNTASAIGGSDHPVYVDSTGHVVACDFTLRTVTVMPTNPEPGCWYFIVE